MPRAQHLAAFLLATLVACSSTPEPTSSGEPAATDAPASDAPPVDAPPAADRPEMTADECQSKGGTVVGDIGDGAVHKPDYKCPSGSPPIGRIALGVEGSVCCAGAAGAGADAPPATGKPASSLKIGDKSVSTVDLATIKAALEKAGYAVMGDDAFVTCGDSETLQMSVSKNGKPMGLISLQRPVAKPDSCKPTPVKEAYEKWTPSAEGPKAKNALSLDEPAGVLVAINLMKDEPGAAKKLLDALVTK